MYMNRSVDITVTPQILTRPASNLTTPPQSLTVQKLLPGTTNTHPLHKPTANALIFPLSPNSKHSTLSSVCQPGEREAGDGWDTYIEMENDKTHISKIQAH
ncbi:hypothetical protein BDD12DRAFT_841294 [Trichophaea hybrida]|nr:hypothetical protein BDD12DRAFT_841294 [Trichophaea hybrida]